MEDEKLEQNPDLKKEEIDVLDKLYQDYEKMAHNLYKIICDHYRQKNKNGLS